jgi:hypothetical protein
MAGTFDIIDQLLGDPVLGPQISTLRRLKTHEIVARVVDHAERVSVVCSCGLTLELPEAINETLGFTTSIVPWTYLRRGVQDVHELEEWFYCESGHFDHSDEADSRVFITFFGCRVSPPDRRIWCAACKEFEPFYSGGGTHLYRPGAHTEQVEKHLAECAAIAREDKLREWSHAMWRAVRASKPGTRIFGRPPLARNGDTAQAPSDTNDSDKK